MKTEATMKIAHITDTQLGYRQYGLQGREEDFCRAAAAAMTDMVRSGVQAVLITGDQFEMPKPPAATVRLLQTLAKNLTDAGMEVLGIEGNHDASGGHWLDVCGIYNLGLGSVNVMAGGSKVRVGGVSYVKDCDFLGVLADYLAANGPMDILCMHQGMTEVCPFTSIPMRAVTELVKLAGVQYVACGHIHNRFYLLDDGIIYSCPGSTEMTDMNEKPEKWWSIIDTDSWTTEYRKIPVRPITMIAADTDEQFEKMLADVSGREIPYSFVMASVNRNIMDGADRLEKAAGARGTALRLMMYSPDQVKVAVDAKPSWERDKGMLDLRTMVAKDFAPGTEQHSLITQIIDAPDRAEEILGGFINTNMETA
jgi:DNA repair exonuclease SbcCD nuclease subunit